MAHTKKEKKNNLSKIKDTKFWKFCRKNMIELIAGAILVIFIFVEIFVWKKQDYCFIYTIMGRSTQDAFYINNIIVILLLFLDSIIAISYSVSNQKVYEATVAEYRSLIEERNEYSLTKIIMISIVLFAGAIVFYYTNLGATTLILNVIALIYCIIFCLTEIPILAKDKNVLYAIASDALQEKSKQNMKNEFSDNDIDPTLHIPLPDSQKQAVTKPEIKSSGNETENYQILRNITGSMVINMGLIKACQKLKIKNSLETSELVDEYLDLVSVQLKDPTKNTTKLMDCVMKNLDELVPYKIYEIDDNLKYLFDKIDKASISKLIIGIHQTINDDESLKSYSKEFDDCIENIILRVKMPESDDNKRYEIEKPIFRYFTDISNFLLVDTLQRHDLWYAKYILNAYKGYLQGPMPFQRSKYSQDYFAFVTIYLSLISSFNGFKPKIKTFLSKYWLDILRKAYLNDNCACFFADLLNSLVYFENSPAFKDHIYYDFSLSRYRNYELYGSKVYPLNFDSHSLLLCWIELVVVIYKDGSLPDDFVDRVYEQIRYGDIKNLFLGFCQYDENDSDKCKLKHLSALSRDSEKTKRIFDQLNNQAKQFQLNQQND